MAFEVIETASKNDWLKTRREYVTATDAALLVGGTDAARRQVWDRKHGRDTFTGNAYTAWGLQREPAIAAAVTEKYPGLKHNEFLHVKTNTRYACTPDMVGVDNEGNSFSCQIKTVGENRAWDDISDLPDNYRAQVEWEMMVLGITRSLVAWEVRSGRPGDFEAGELRMRVVESDPALWARLVTEADKFLAWQPPEAVVVNDQLGDELRIEDLRELGDKIREIRADLKATQDEYDILATYLSDKYSTGTYRFDDRILEIAPGRKSRRFDRKRFEKDHPDLAGDYVLESVGKPRVTVKEV